MRLPENGSARATPAGEIVVSAAISAIVQPMEAARVTTARSITILGRPAPWPGGGPQRLDAP